MRRSFSTKLLLFFLLFVLVALCIMGTYAYTSSLKVVRQQAESNVAGTIVQMRDNIGYRIADIGRIADELYFDQDFQRNLRFVEEGYVSLSVVQNTIMPRLENLLAKTMQDTRISLYLQNTHIRERYYLRGPETNPLAVGRRFDILHLNRIANQEWYGAIADTVTDNAWLAVEEDAGFQNISIVRHLRDFNRASVYGFLRITASVPELLQAVDYRQVDEHLSLYVLDAQYELIYASAGSRLTQEELVDRLASGTDLLFQERIPGAEWTLLALLPYSVLDREATGILRVTLAVGLSSFLLLGLIGIAVSRMLGRRIGKLVLSLDAFRQGDFKRRIRYSGQDEFARIADSFNRMAAHIDELIHEVYIRSLEVKDGKLRLKEAEYETLVAQINPHFLYNTLSSIETLTHFQADEKIRQMVNDLATFYRLTLNQGQAMIAVDKEIAHVQAYINIQKIRFGSSLQASYDIAPEVREGMTLKLLLQPFVENVLEHALYEASIHVRIVVARQGERLWLKVIDNGVGMSRETVAQLLAGPGPSLGYGIYNVDQRIKLQFGAAYGVRIHSGPGIGTCVLVEVPWLE